MLSSFSAPYSSNAGWCLQSDGWCTDSHLQNRGPVPGLPLARRRNRDHEYSHRHRHGGRRQSERHTQHRQSEVCPWTPHGHVFTYSAVCPSTRSTRLTLNLILRAGLCLLTDDRPLPSRRRRASVQSHQKKIKKKVLAAQLSGATCSDSAALGRLGGRMAREPLLRVHGAAQHTHPTPVKNNRCCVLSGKSALFHGHCEPPWP